MITAYVGAVPDKAIMDKDTFADSVNPYLNYINSDFVPQANALETNVNAKEVSVVAASTVAVAAANFQGTWTDQLTVVGQSWEYSGVIYGVLVAGTASPATTPANWFALTIAQSIKNTPAGNISATTVQAALNELDNEKAPKSAPVFTDGVSITGGLNLESSIVFEGATEDAFETTLTVTDPTADNTIIFPDTSGTVALLNSPAFTGSITSSDGLISVISGVYSATTNVVTVVLTVASHTVAVGQIVKISGITNAVASTGGGNVVFNGYQNVTAQTPTTITFIINVPIGTISSTSLTGTIVLSEGGLYLDSAPKVKKGGIYAPIQSPLAWVNFDGTTSPPTIRNSFNVSALVKTAGSVKIYFKDNMNLDGNSINFTFSIPTLSTTVYGGYVTLGANYVEVWVKQHTGDTWAFSTQENLQIFGGTA